jgi:DNA-binding MurR/RpiR family transcriptional regulator
LLHFEKTFYDQIAREGETMSQDSDDGHRPLPMRLRACYEELPKSERPLADVLLEFPGDLVMCSATELAQRVDVSNAAVTRLIKRLGYSDYREAQREVRASQEAGHPLYLNNSLVKPADQADSLQDHLERDLFNLRSTFENIDSASISAGIKALAGARRVWVIGFRNSYFLAAYARRQLIQARDDVYLVPQPGQTTMEELAGAGVDDVVLAVGMRRRTPQLRKVMQVLSSEGVPIIYLTDRRTVATREYATWTFACHTRGISLFDSNVAAISLLNYLCTEVVVQMGEGARARLERIETFLSRANEIEYKN